jgi:hypothetical protein
LGTQSDSVPPLLPSQSLGQSWSRQPARTKKRSISKDRRLHLQKKHEERNWGTGSSKREQFFRDREVSLTAGELTLAEGRQQLDADRKQLSHTESKLMKKSRQKFREADARMAHANGETAFARSLVLSSAASLAATS